MKRFFQHSPAAPQLNSQLSLALAFLALSLNSCGSSGSEKEIRIPDYAGAWSASVELVSNTCPRQIPEQFLEINARHKVEQYLNRDTDSQGNEQLSLTVTLDDGSDTYQGLGEINAAGQGDSFSVTGSEHELSNFLKNYRCSEILDYEYSAIDFSRDIAGFVKRHSSINCKNSNSSLTCDVTYTGSAYRLSRGD